MYHFKRQISHRLNKTLILYQKFATKIFGSSVSKRKFYCGEGTEANESQQIPQTFTAVTPAIRLTDIILSHVI